LSFEGVTKEKKMILKSEIEEMPQKEGFDVGGGSLSEETKD
jgi:hypothetical protein